MIRDESNEVTPAAEERTEGAQRRRTPVPSPPAEARFPGWLLPILAAIVAGVFAGWMGAVFGAVVGFLVWRARA